MRATSTLLSVASGFVALLLIAMQGGAAARTQLGNFQDLDAPPDVNAYAAAVSGTIIAAGSMVIDGHPVFCGTRPTVLDPNLDDYAAAFPGYIIINPRLIARVPTPVKLWIYSHECAHQFRGSDESKADCFAVQRGRRQGWLTTDGLDQVCTFIAPARGSLMHPPGPERCRIMRVCYDEKRVH